MVQIAAWRCTDANEGDELDPGEAFEQAEVARKAARAGDLSSTAFFAAASKTTKIAAVRAAGSSKGV